MTDGANNLKGDVIGLLDAGGTQVVSYSYNSWGRMTGMTDTSNALIGIMNPFRYRGYILDDETGLYYVGARYYDPETGRFISPDTQLVIDSNFTGVNLYIYCGDNAINYYDPNGNACICLTQRVRGGHVCNTNEIANAYDNAVDISEFAIKGALTLAKHAYSTASKPANIGSGTFGKIIGTKVAGLSLAIKQTDDVFSGLAYLGVAVEVGENMHNNIQNDASTEKIVWDATVDTAILSLNTYTAMAAGTAIGTMICPGGSTMIGLGAGIVIEIILDITSQETRRYFKSWIK